MFVVDEPLKKPIPLHEQTVKDEKGRYQRFHGAFTGGFSAGYFNTVGSKEGERHPTRNPWVQNRHELMWTYRCVSVRMDSVYIRVVTAAESGEASGSTGRLHG